MRAWPSRFDGLRLRLAPGWYPLPAHVSFEERRRLCELLADGLEDVDAVVELDWSQLDALPELALERAVVVVCAPEDVLPGDEALGRVRALSGARVGLLHYAAASAWPQLAWLERELKAPLVLWLRRWLRRAEHPLAGVGIADAPVEELAALTPDPVELLLMLEALIEHRTRHRGLGMSADDWARSLVHVGAERLALRLRRVPTELRAAALDVARTGGEGPFVPPAELREGAVALTHAGLAWEGGNDMLLAPLARLAGRRDSLRLLLGALPEDAWSEAGREALREVVGSALAPPRAVLSSPWPRLRPVAPAFVLLPRIHSDWMRLLHSDAGVGSALHRLCAELIAQQQLPDEAFQATVAMLRDIEDERLLALDVERGRMHRFDAVERAWADHPRADAIGAFLRWCVVAELNREPRAQPELALLDAELAQALELAKDETSISFALRVLQGELLAQRGHFGPAVEIWSELAPPSDDRDAERQLPLRRLLAELRLDLDIGPPSRSFDFRGLDAALSVANALVTHRQANGRRLTLGDYALEVFFGPRVESPALHVTEAAIALELRDWPRAHHLLTHTIDAAPATPEGARAHYIGAWLRACLGELDEAAQDFKAVHERADDWGDELLIALCERGHALVALARGRREQAYAKLEQAIALERELGLPDAEQLAEELSALRRAAVLP